MKICAIVCEFNPFHNGHAHLIEKAKALSGCDGVLCIMSGNFTQRGEMCITDKYTRAKHALLGGATCVIQLPAPFAVAPAEIFAKGAIKILHSIPEVQCIAFGCESGDKQSFLQSAHIALNESEAFKGILANALADGESYIKAYAKAFTQCGGDIAFVSNANNILALEYTKAIVSAGSKIDILPIRRIGAGYNDCELHANYSSASAIRQNADDPAVKGNVPPFVYEDLAHKSNGVQYESLLRSCLFNADTDSLKSIYGCGEGLENRLKSLANRSVDEIIATVTSRRYSASRIRRILCANALRLYAPDCEKFLGGELYIKPLAVKKDAADSMLAALARSPYPVVTGISCEKLSDTAKQCFEKDKYEHSVYNFINGTQIKDYTLII